MKFNHGHGHIRIGRLIVTTATQRTHAPWIDGGTTGLVHDDGLGHTLEERFGAIVLHWPGTIRALAIGWQNARIPNPRRWTPARLYRYAQWVRAGRPLGQNMAVIEDEATDNQHAGQF